MAQSPKLISIAAKDGTPLSATLYRPQAAATGPITVVAPGSGISQRFYKPFAEALAARGRPALTFDYRGVGASLSGPVIKSKARFRDWGRLDVPAVIDWASQTYPHTPLHWVGHSYGGGFGVGLAPNAHKIARVVSVATTFGYWGDMSWPERYRAGFMAFAVMPALLGLTGHLPGRWSGLGADLPPGVGWEWRSMILNKHRVFDAPDWDARSSFAHSRADMLFLHVFDDPWANAAAVARIASAFTGARTAIRRLHAAPGESIGHVGYFRSKFAHSLWPAAFDWLDQ